MATGRTIIRVKHRRSPFAVIDRRVLEDSRLSWAARGVLGYLFAKPDDWTLNVEDLRRRGDLGRDALYKILKQLQRVGYVRREFTRDANGRVTGVVYAVFEVPEGATHLFVAARDIFYEDNQQEPEDPLEVTISAIYAPEWEPRINRVSRRR